jgi:hypothetical protein
LGASLASLAQLLLIPISLASIAGDDRIRLN